MNATQAKQKSEEISRLVSLSLVAVVLLGSAYVLCRVGAEERRLTIAVKQGVEGVALKEIAQNFSRHTNISVEVVELQYDELYEEEMRQLKSRPRRQRNAVPPFDVIMVDDPWLYSFVYGPDSDNNKPRLENLTSVLKGKTADFFPKTLDVAKYCPAGDSCSDYFAIPFVANSQLFAYRTSDFAGSPSTWKDVCDASKKRTPSSIGYVTRIGSGNSIVTDFMPILWAYDPDSFPERSSGPPLRHPDSAFETLNILVATRKNLASASFDDFDVSAYLQKQRASTGIVWSAWAMMLANTDSTARRLTSKGDSNTPQSERVTKLQDSLLSQPPDVGKGKEGDDSSIRFKEKLVFASMPRGSGEKFEPELGVWLLAIPSESDQTDLALEFIEYATDLRQDPGTQPNEQSLVAAHRGTPPPRKSVLAKLERESEYWNEHPSLIPKIRWSLENARPGHVLHAGRGSNPFWEHISKRSSINRRIART